MKITLWRENKANQAWEIEATELVKKFKKSRYYSLRNSQGKEFALRLFICSKDGLNSVWEEKDFQNIIQKYQDKL